MDDYTEEELAHVRALGRQIAAERVALGLSQDELARRTGMSRKSVTRYENGERDPAMGILNRIADALGVELTDLMLAAEERAGRDGVPPAKR